MIGPRSCSPEGAAPIINEGCVVLEPALLPSTGVPAASSPEPGPPVWARYVNAAPPLAHHGAPRTEVSPPSASKCIGWTLEREGPLEIT